jgi:hypothetical protein
MRLSAAFAASAALLSVTLRAGAQTAPPPQATPNADAPEVASSERDAATYCEFVKGVADSQAFPTLLPTAFVTGGIVSGEDLTGTPQAGFTLLGPSWRLIAGGSYSISGLYRGLSLRAGAEAECKRHKAVSQLFAFLESNHEGMTRASLEARLAALDEALPHAEELLNTAKAQMLQSRLSVEQLEALQVKVEALRTQAGETRASIGALARAPAPPTEPIRDVLRERDEAEADAQRYEARVRVSQAWDVNFKGGYDQTYGTGFAYVPVFALATVSVNLGIVFAPAAENRALAGRVGASRAELFGPSDRVNQAIAQLGAVRDAERKRAEETRVLLADLETRYKSLQSVPGAKVEEYAQYVWFDLVTTRANHAFYEAHIKDLDRLLR